MTDIRIPKEAAPLLPYCRPSLNSRSNACFDTYADFIIFVASYGFYKTGKDGNQAVSEFLDQPYPVDIDIFKNRNLFPQILFLGISLTGSHKIVTDEERLARMIENYAFQGCRELNELLKKNYS